MLIKLFLTEITLKKKDERKKRREKENDSQ